MTQSCLLETIVISLDDARAAAAAGADRFELCSALALGGLTPSAGVLAKIKNEIEVPVLCMVRPREGGMAYAAGEFETMLLDAEIFLDSGADGLVFGVLTPEGRLDLPRIREFLKVVRKAAGTRPVTTTFHRAFDVVAEPERALEELIELGVDRILTSGRAATALEGAERIRALRERAGGRIGILPGGGIGLDNLREVVQRTGTDEVHLYLSRRDNDPSPAGNPKIYFGARLPVGETEFHSVDGEAVRRARALLDAP